MNMNVDADKVIQPLRNAVKKQGDKIRDMKTSGASEIDIKNEVQILKMRKKELESMILKLSPQDNFDRTKMVDLIKRRFFYDISFAIYGGITGQYDFGPMGCVIIDNMLSEWHKFFVIQERMLKINCSILTPEPVLKASGHIDKFADFMVKDIITGECFRLDHMIKQQFEKILSDKKTTEEDRKEINRKLILLEGMSMTEMNELVKTYQLKSPSTGNDLSDAVEFNLMFPIHIGPTGHVKGFLRPETAQGIFVNFKRLYEYNHRKLPFACAQVGNAYRNEISPRSGLLRVREFTMAEIEHFCYPDDKDHPKFHQIMDTKMWLYSACNQMNGISPILMTIGEAVKEGLVENETIGYYMAKIQLYMITIGINADKLRFRQHLSNEMAHYARDCWDAECLTSYGWIECVGCADRSAYDLNQHSKATGTRLSVERLLPKPRTVENVFPVLDKSCIGKVFKKDAKSVQEILTSMTNVEVEDMENNLNKIGEFELPGGFKITRQMVTKIKKEKKEIHIEEIVPSVIEPSFGIGRIFYTLLEHNFRIRDDDDSRTFFSLPTLISPVKVSILPLSNKPEFEPFTSQLEKELTLLNISLKVDDSTGSIGRRYARTDEVAIPFAITIDFDTVNNSPHTVTLRERDTMLQIRIAIEKVPETIQQLADGKITWENVVNLWPKFTAQETTK